MIAWSQESLWSLGMITHAQGAGHSAAMDRPGPMLQLIAAFVTGRGYNESAPYDLRRQPLLPRYAVCREREREKKREREDLYTDDR